MRVRDKYMLAFPVPHIYGVLALSACLSLCQSMELSCGGLFLVWFYAAVIQGFNHNRTYLLWVVLGCTFSLSGFVSLLAPMLPLLWFWDQGRIKKRFERIEIELVKLSEFVENMKIRLITKFEQEFPIVAERFHKPQAYIEFVEDHRENIEFWFKWLEKKRIIRTPECNFDQLATLAIETDPVYDEQCKKLKILILINAIICNIFVLGNFGFLALVMIGLVLWMEETSIQTTKASLVQELNQNLVDTGEVQMDSPEIRQDNINSYDLISDGQEEQGESGDQTVFNPAFLGLVKVKQRSFKTRIKVVTNVKKTQMHDKQTKDLLRKRKNRVAFLLKGAALKTDNISTQDMEKTIEENRHEMRKHGTRLKQHCRKTMASNKDNESENFYNHGTTNHAPGKPQHDQDQLKEEHEYDADTKNKLKSHEKGKFGWKQLPRGEKAMTSRDILQTLSQIGIERLLTHWESNKANNNIAKQQEKPYRKNNRPFKPKWGRESANTTAT